MQGLMRVVFTVLLLVISNVVIDRSAVCATYRFTDIYNQHYWTDIID